MICRVVHLGKYLQCSVITTNLDKCKERKRGQTLKQRGGSETFQPGIESVEVLGTFVIFFFLGTISTDIGLKPTSARGKTNGKLYVIRIKTEMVSRNDEILTQNF